MVGNSSEKVLFASLTSVVLASCLASGTLATDEGQAAADEVEQAIYYDLMDNWLYTHAGDDRGYGPEHDLARDNIALLLESYGLTVTLEPFQYSSSTYYNVVGEKSGTLYPDQIYIVGAHYDSVNNPGADDDASGVALFLEAARIVSQYDSEYTIRFIGFDREEQGLVGSYAYVAAHNGEDILGMLQADMVAYDTDTNHARIYGTSASNPIKMSLGAAIDEYSNGLTWGDHGSSGGSDHAPFEYAGYQACLLIENIFNPYYHSEQDNMDNPDCINWEYAYKMTRSAVGWLVDQARVEVTIDGLKFVYPDGLPEFVAPSGGTKMRVEIQGMGDVDPQPGTGVLHYDVGSGWQSAAMEVVADNVYDAVFPSAVCGDEVLFYVSAEAIGGQVYTHPKNAPSVHHTSLAAYGYAAAHEFPFDVDPGWGTEDQWAFGQPTGGGGEYGGPDPTSGYTGPNVYGYNLNGDYTNDLPERHLTSDAINCTGLDGVHLTFWRWLGVEQSVYDHAYVRVSTNGANWTTVWENGGEVADSEWIQADIDISDVADNESTVYLRWTMGSTDGGWRYCGWNIDDVRIVALDCENPCPADVNGDDIVDIDDLFQVLGAWGTCDDCPEDINDDGLVDIDDVFAVLAGWGPCP